MTPTFCLEYDEDLSALLDGELAPERAEEVRSHVAVCARCAARLAAFARVDSTLSRQAAMQPLPVDLEARLRERIDAEEAGRSAPPAQRARAGAAPRRPGRWVPWIGAAAAGCAALALFVLLRPGREDALRGADGIAQAPAARPAPAPAPRVLAERAPAPTPHRVEEPAPSSPSPSPSDADLADASEDELSLGLELSQLGDDDLHQTVSDLDVIQNLDAVERLDTLDPGNRG